MILNACTLSPGNVGIAFKSSPPGASTRKGSCLPEVAKYLKVRSLYDINPGRHVLCSGGIRSLKRSSSSASLLKGGHDLTSFVPFPSRIHNVKSSRHLSPPRAAKDNPSKGFRYPAMTKKPPFWWRALAILPYFMPFHECWFFAETTYHLLPFFEDFEFITMPFLEFLGTVPNWFFMSYFLLAYLGIVRRKEWPHFFKFHVIMGMLLEIVFQVLGTLTRWMPESVYWGKLGMHLWTGLAFGFLFTTVECARCAFAGKYADVPFMCDAAYMQIPFD